MLRIPDAYSKLFASSANSFTASETTLHFMSLDLKPTNTEDYFYLILR